MPLTGGSGSGSSFLRIEILHGGGGDPDPDPGRDPDPDPYPRLVVRCPDPGVPETRGSGGSGPEFGSGSATLAPGMGGGGVPTLPCLEKSP